MVFYQGTLINPWDICYIVSTCYHMVWEVYVLHLFYIGAWNLKTTETGAGDRSSDRRKKNLSWTNLKCKKMAYVYNRSMLRHLHTFFIKPVTTKKKVQSCCLIKLTLYQMKLKLYLHIPQCDHFLEINLWSKNVYMGFAGKETSDVSFTHESILWVTQIWAIW